MPTLTIRDDTVWIKHMEADPATKALLVRWPAGLRILMDVAGQKGEWEKMADGKDGRPTNGFKPVGQMKDIWKSMQSRRGETVAFEIIGRTAPYLSAMSTLLTEWDSAEDESAFRDL